MWVAGCTAGYRQSISHSLAYSEDGLHWNTVENDPFTGTKRTIFSIAFADGLFVAAGASEDGTTVAYSKDGVVWRQSPNDPGFGNAGYSIVYGGGTWLFTYSDNEGIYYSSFSNDPSSGSSWSPKLLQNIFDTVLISVFPTNTEKYAWFNFSYYVSSFPSTTTDVRQAFTQVTDFYLPNSNVARGVIGNETTLVIVSNDDNYLYTSSDGANNTWNRSYFLGNNKNIKCLLYGNNVWVAAGDGLFYSDDYGSTWKDTNMTDSFENIAFNGNQWQAYTGSTMYYSQDGKVWVLSSFDQPILSLQSNLPGTILAYQYTQIGK
jgi:hypothetical protein